MTTSAVSPPAPPTDLAQALSRIREHGGRVTRAKRSIAALLFESNGPLTADDIAEQTSEEQSVVYRTLGQFEVLGIVEHVHAGHGPALYRRRGLSTVPVTCTGCGATVELAVADTADFTRRVAQRTGIDVDLVHFPLTGRCAKCRP